MERCLYVKVFAGGLLLGEWPGLACIYRITVDCFYKIILAAVVARTPE